MRPRSGTLLALALALAAVLGCDEQRGGSLPSGSFTGGPPGSGPTGTFGGGPTGSGTFGGGTAAPTAPSSGASMGRGGSSGTVVRPGSGGSTGTRGNGGSTGGTPSPLGGRGGAPTPAPAPVGSPLPMTACKNIDLVFSIDNSSSMADEQRVMGTTIFPAFASKLRMISPTLQSFRVGVLDACPMPAAFHTRGRGGPCNFADGKPWIESSSPRLEQEFACVGAIDSTGKACSGQNDDEQPVSTATASLEPPAITGPNAGFLRRDAVLVVLAMTDEDEQPTPPRNARQVAERLTAIKGDPRMVVLLGIGGLRQCNGPYGMADNARFLQQVTQIFAARGRGVFWDLCAGSLEEGLGQAIAVIQKACQEAPPVPPAPPPPPSRDAGTDITVIE